MPPFRSLVIAVQDEIDLTGGTFEASLFFDLLGGDGPANAEMLVRRVLLFFRDTA